MRSIAIVMVAAAGLLAASAHAQPPEQPVRSLSEGEAARLMGAAGTPGSGGPPLTVIGTAFGNIPASVWRSGCQGYSTEQPDFVLNLERARERLSVYTESGEDLILIIEKPDGTRVCDDDSGPGHNPLISMTNVRPGRYRIWVGVYDLSTISDYTLRLSSNPQAPLFND
jgi:hypothetical protein